MPASVAIWRTVPASSRGAEYTSIVAQAMAGFLVAGTAGGLFAARHAIE